MKFLVTLGKRFVKEDKAAEVTELGIVLALVVVASVAVLTQIGPILRDVYQAVLTAITPVAG